MVKKKLSEEEKKSYSEKHRHIAPELVAGTHSQSVRNDVFSMGRVFKSIQKIAKLEFFDEIVLKCLCLISQRISSSEVKQLISNLMPQLDSEPYICFTKQPLILIF